jgi:hypothetical protein
LFLILRHRRDLETRIRQRLNDAFRGLFGLLRTHRVVRAIFSGIAKCGRNDRNSLMGIGQSALLGFCIIRSLFSRWKIAPSARKISRQRSGSERKLRLETDESRRPLPWGSSSGGIGLQPVRQALQGGCELLGV